MSATGTGANIVWQPTTLPTVTAPTLAGDVTGPVGSNIVERLRNVTVSSTAPTSGQVLRATTVGGNIVWQPFTLPPTAAPTLAGDVTGPAGTTVVERIRNVTVSSTAPTAGQVLRATTVGGNIVWQPFTLPPPAAPTLAGDVTGPAGNTEIAELQGTPVSASGPGPGQILLTVPQGGGVVWQAQTPAFVQHPEKAGPYAIVAAGIVGDGTQRDPIYNDLTMKFIGSNQFLLHFDGYELPKDRFTYIVKVLPVFSPDFPGQIVSFVAYTDDGIVLNVVSITGRINEKLELMVEISQYPFPVPN